MNQALVISFFLLGIMASASSRVSRHKVATRHEHTDRIKNIHGGIIIRGPNRLGEDTLRVRYGKYHALEVTIPKIGEAGMYYRQVTDGRHFLEAVYQGHTTLFDCDMNRDKNDIKKFLHDFHLVENAAREHGGNMTVSVVLDRKGLDKMAMNLLDVSALRSTCKIFHRQQRHHMRTMQGEKGENQNKHIEKIIMGNALAAFSHLQGQEVTLPTVPATSKAEAPAPVHSSSGRRVKRSFIYPGTNWCGSGNTATYYQDLGENVATDKCCRDHDHCPYTISGFTSRYNHFNYRFHTLSHCQCDEMFRSCLRSAANSVADMVGSVYFNVVGMKCFTLSKIEVCDKRSWWGRCIEYTDDFEAEVNDPFEY